jgi:hypothetical protein
MVAEKQQSDNAVMVETPSEVIHASGYINADAHVVQRQSQHKRAQLQSKQPEEAEKRGTSRGE